MKRLLVYFARLLFCGLKPDLCFHQNMHQVCSGCVKGPSAPVECVRMDNTDLTQTTTVPALSVMRREVAGSLTELLLSGAENGSQ